VKLTFSCTDVVEPGCSGSREHSIVTQLAVCDGQFRLTTLADNLEDSNLVLRGL